MGSIGQRTGRLRRSWFVRVPVLAIGLVVALTLRDIVMGIVGGLLRLGSHAARLWLGRTRTAVATTSAAAVYSIVGFVATVAIGFGLYSVYVRRMEQRPVSEL